MGVFDKEELVFIEENRGLIDSLDFTELARLDFNPPSYIKDGTSILRISLIVAMMTNTPIEVKFPVKLGWNNLATLWIIGNQTNGFRDNLFSDGYKEEGPDGQFIDIEYIKNLVESKEIFNIYGHLMAIPRDLVEKAKVTFKSTI